MDRLKYDVDLIKIAIAPIKKDVIVGSIKIMLDGKVLKSTDLITLSEVAEGSLFKQIKDSIKESFEGL